MNSVKTIILNGWKNFLKNFTASIFLSSLYIILSYLFYKYDYSKGIITTILILPILISIYGLFIHNLKIIKALSFGFQTFLHSLGLLLTNLLIIILGLLLLIVPGIIAGILLMYSFPILLAEELSILESIKKSIKMVRLNSLTNSILFSYIVLLTLLSIIIPYIYIFILPLEISTIISGYNYFKEKDIDLNGNN